MNFLKKAAPAFFALIFVSAASFVFFIKNRPELASQVKGFKSLKSETPYLETIPLPDGSKEVGKSAREGFFQITAFCPKPPKDVQRFFKNVLVFKGWRPKFDDEESLHLVYVRDNEKIEVSILSTSSESESIFSISHVY